MNTLKTHTFTTTNRSTIAQTLTDLAKSEPYTTHAAEGRGPQITYAKDLDQFSVKRTPFSTPIQTRDAAEACGTLELFLTVDRPAVDVHRQGYSLLSDHAFPDVVLTTVGLQASMVVIRRPDVQSLIRDLICTLPYGEQEDLISALYEGHD